MKIIAVNGSPRKNGNTATLLKHALDGAKAAGADTKVIHLYDLHYQGCVSCFACKLKNSEFIGRCAMRDELTPVLEQAVECDALLFGSPIYLGGVTGMMHSFLERLIFMNASYEALGKSNFTGRIASAFIYTMNVTKEDSVHYLPVYEINNRFLQILNGHTEYYISADTYQFDDYSKYDAGVFNEPHKAAVRKQQFLSDCEAVFKIGRRLAGGRDF